MADQITRSAARIATAVAVPAAVLVGALVFWLLGGAPAGQPANRAAGGNTTSARPQSTAPVAVAAPQLSERAATVCRALLSQLPDTLRDLPRRPVTEGSEQNAAYGDPAIILACGVPPASYQPDDVLYTMSNVCWYATEEPGGTVWTTVDREVPVRVTVPKEYDGPGDWVSEFSDPLVATVLSRPAAELPSGCY